VLSANRSSTARRTEAVLKSLSQTMGLGMVQLT